MFVKTNTVKAIIDYYHESLNLTYTTTEIEVLLEIVFEYFLKFNKLDLRSKQANHLSESELLDFHFTLKRLKQKEPIQYILGESPFMGMMFKIDKHVLIPRPETEELVDWIINSIGSESKILDIGTGSGCIPLALKKLNSNFDISAIDVDPNTIKVAENNANNLKLSVDFHCVDVLSLKSIKSINEKQFDCIVSNPPYIGHSEKLQMDKSVVDFEPHLALFVDDEDPMIFYKRITQLAIEHLPKDGHLFFESNQRYCDEVAAIMAMVGFSNIEIKKDINNNPRMIHGIR